MKPNIRLIALFLAFASLSTMALGSIPMVSAGGPATQDLLIKIYFDPTTESWALDTGEIDINDWPLAKDFVDRWTGSSTITMDEYAEIGKMEFDINNQWWPTGPNDPTHSGGAAPRNTFYNPAGVRDVAALHFRRAVAHLTNKAKYTTQFMGGMGYVMETEVPVPALEGFTDYASLENSTAKAARADNIYSDRGFIYEYDTLAAAQEFYLGGFRDYDGDTYREWRHPGADGIYGTGDDGAIEELPNMKFWMRIDDPNRRQAGEDLYNEMVAAGIPAAAGADAAGLEKIVTERSACFNNVMVLYKYNFYTGGWSLGSDLDWIYDLYHSSMGQYAWATNYAGFKNAEYDAVVSKVKYPDSLADVKNAAIQAQWVKAKYMPVVELWAAKGVKAYRTGWDGVVNAAGSGIDNGYSFGMMNQTGRTDIKWGFKSDISALHVYTSEWLWDWNVLGLIYDSLLGGNPFDLSEDVGGIASSWSTTSSYPGWEGKTVAEYTVRTDASFHDGSPVKPADVAYSLLSVRDAGSGNAWNFPMAMDINKVEISGQIVRVYFNVKSAFALHWAGFMPIVNKDLWNQAIGTGTTAGYSLVIPDDTNGVYTGGTYANPAAIRDYHPWEVSTYGNPAIIDLAEDGGAAWKFVSYTPGQTVRLTAFTGFYALMARWRFAWVKIQWGPLKFKGNWAIPFWKWYTTKSFVAEAFHERGNVNFASTYNATDDTYSGSVGVTKGWYTSDPSPVIDLSDLTRIATSMPSSTGTNTSLWPELNWGNGAAQYNIDADVSFDYNVNVIDLATAGINFNKKQG